MAERGATTFLPRIRFIISVEWSGRKNATRFNNIGEIAIHHRRSSGNPLVSVGRVSGGGSVSCRPLDDGPRLLPLRGEGEGVDTVVVEARGRRVPDRPGLGHVELVDLRFPEMSVFADAGSVTSPASSFVMRFSIGVSFVDAVKLTGSTSRSASSRS